MSEVKEVIAETPGENYLEEDTAKEAETISDLERSIIFQVEHYFSDRNIRRDEFLKNTLKDHDGWLPLDILTTFKRLANLTTDTVIIAKALKKSSGILEVSEDNNKVRRRPDKPVKKMTPRLKKDIRDRTIYAKGYPEDTVFEDLLSHYEKYNMENIMMRKFKNGPMHGVFKGSVYITFKTREQAEKFIESGPHEYQGKTLEVLWQARD